MIEHVKDQNVEFMYARDGSLWYKTTKSDLLFPVPFEDVGSAQFGRIEKATLLMRWIRIWLQDMEAAK